MSANSSPKKRNLSVTDGELDDLAEALDAYIEMLEHEVGAEDLKGTRKLLKRIKHLLGEDDNE